ncbi:MAG: MerR family transcriptional regulator [Bacteroidota bacterium]
MKNYSVKELALLAGITVRTLHHYDRIGLLKPGVRTRKGYRQYGETELLKLQQIMIYKEMDFSLREIKNLLEAPDFDVLSALEDHKRNIAKRRKRLSNLLITLDKTIHHLKEGIMLDPKELYEGFPDGKGESYREEALEKWGDAVKDSEKSLMQMSKPDFNQLKQDFDDCWRKLASYVGRDYRDQECQEEIAKHYRYILQFWGVQNLQEDHKKPYLGLADLYINDGRFTEIDGKQVAGFGEFLKKAMTFFVENSEE